MALTISAKHPHLPDGAELGVAGAFVVPNNGSVELTEEQERDFIASNFATVSDALEGSEVFEVSGTPTVSDIADVLPEQQVEDIRNTDMAALGVKTGEEEVATQQEQPTQQVRIINPDQQDRGGEQ